MKKRIIIVLLYFLPSFCFSQNKQLISENFKNVSLPSFLGELEGKLNCKFFYDPQRLDSIRITVSLIDLNLNQVLKKVFDSTEIQFSINDQGQVFLNRGKKVFTPFSSNFFENEPLQEKVKEEIESNSNFSFKEEKIPRADLENKLYRIGNGLDLTGKSKINGYIKNFKDGQPVVGVSILVKGTNIGTVSDSKGYYSLNLPKGRFELIIRGIGNRPTKREIILKGDGSLNIDLQEEIENLKEVTVSAIKLANIRQVGMGVQRLEIKNIKQVPTTFGETDLLQVVLTLPGVKSVGEATTGFNVRGGSSDQNLILFNGATIYNPSHFFGFFSALNSDVIKDIELYKSSIPAKYGGRLSSVLKLDGKEGNKNSFQGNAGIGPLTSRISLEGPIIKNHTSFVFGGRTTYSNWILNSIPASSGYGRSKADFYDLNLILNSQVDKNNNINLTGYSSHDDFKLNSDTLYNYNNKNASLIWRHIFGKKFTGIFTGGYDHYDYNNSSTQDSLKGYKLSFSINQAHARADFTYSLNSAHTFEYGLSYLRYQLRPGSYTPLGSYSLVKPLILENEQGAESAVYFSDKWEINSKLSLDLGTRFSRYTYLGPHLVYNYVAGIPKVFADVIDSTQFPKGSNIKTYYGPEFRFSGRFLLDENSSVKASFNSLRQNIHLLSNTTIISPTDIYKLSDSHIHPQTGNQVSLGFYRNFLKNILETSIEVYYKRIHNYLDYASGAVIVLNPHIETDVVPSEGKAYGIEFLIKKTEGKLNGWLSYTYSRTFLRQNNPNLGAIVNGGKYYPASYDKPNDLSFIGNYRFTHRFSTSLNIIYSTGRPITIPIGKFNYDGSLRPLYGDRNTYRIPDYFRSDIEFNIEGNHKIHQLFHNSWSFGVYNFTFRDNPYSTYFTSRNGGLMGYTLSIFGTAIPFVNYNIRFR